MKEVLKLEYQDVFENGVAVRIIYQDENVLTRGEFRDDELNVISSCCFDFVTDSNTLYLRGFRCDLDNFGKVVSKECAELIKEKVKAINNKYGIKENWRAETGEEYYCITSFLEVNSPLETGILLDEKMYTKGNYFRTEDQAKEVIKRIKKVLDDYHKEIGE